MLKKSLLSLFLLLAIGVAAVFFMIRNDDTDATSVENTNELSTMTQRLNLPNQPEQNMAPTRLHVRSKTINSPIDTPALEEQLLKP